MLAIPALDLRAGRSAGLAAGLAALTERNESPGEEDPLQVAQTLLAAGFSRLHLTDVDAAMSQGENREVIRDLLRQLPVPVQVGGGVREQEQLRELLDEGASHVVVGTRGVEDPTWLRDQAALAPGQVLLALDLRGRRVMTRGGSHDSRRDVLDLIAELDSAELAGVLLTTGAFGARMADAELALLEELVDLSPWPVIAKAVASSLQDLRNLEARGISAVALETSASWPTEPRIIAEEFGE